MGMGHFFRMINLYQVIRRKDVKVVFVLLGEHEPAEKWLQKECMTYEVLSKPSSDWEEKIVELYSPQVWVNDRLNTDEAHNLRLKSLGLKIVTFDDAGDGAKHADVQVAALAPARGEVMTGVQVLTGLEYLILPQEISRYRRLRTSLDRLVVNLGGSDTHGMTVKVVQWLCNHQWTVTVILGPGFKHEKELKEAVAGKTICIKRSVPSLAAEFSNYDFAITGGGLTAYEAAAAGLPTLTVANELHEIGHCLFLQDSGCSRYAGYREEANFELLHEKLDIAKMSRIGMDRVELAGAENIRRKLMNR